MLDEYRVVCRVAALGGSLGDGNCWQGLLHMKSFPSQSADETGTCNFTHASIASHTVLICSLYFQ